MVKVELNGIELYYDGYLQTNLDTAKKQIKKDRDFIFLVDGYEGSGKSLFGMQVGYYLDPTLTIDRICFRAKEFARAVTNADKYQCIIYDEARSGLNARRAMSSVNVTLTNMLSEIRQKNLFIIIILPTFYDLDRNVALWRSMGLFHVYENNWKRGFFRFYNRDEKKYLYTVGKKIYAYDKRYKFSFAGRFTETYPINESEYRKKKAETLKAYDKEVCKVRKTQAQLEKEIRLKMLKKVFPLFESKGLSNREIADALGMHPASVCRDKKNATQYTDVNSAMLTPNTFFLSDSQNSAKNKSD